MILSHNFKLKLFLCVHASVGIQLIDKLYRKLIILSHNFKLKLFLCMHVSVGVELINKLYSKIMIPSHNFKFEIFLCVHVTVGEREREQKLSLMGSGQCSFLILELHAGLTAFCQFRQCLIGGTTFAQSFLGTIFQFINLVLYSMPFFVYHDLPHFFCISSLPTTFFDDKTSNLTAMPNSSVRIVAFIFCSTKS